MPPTVTDVIQRNCQFDFSHLPVPPNVWHRPHFNTMWKMLPYWHFSLSTEN